MLHVVARHFPRPVFIFPWEARLGRHVPVEVFLVISRVVPWVGGVEFRQARVSPCAPRGSSGFPRTAHVRGELAAP